MESGEERSKDFIRQMIDEDNRTGRFNGRVHTRFPPEPNGYLHIGHAKAVVLNFSIAEEYGGKCNLRFDDTNPTTEGDEYVNAIMEDVRWLGYDWGGRVFFASDYFEQMYEYAVDLIKKGLAYVDDLSPEEIKEYRGDVNTPGKPSPYRNRSVEENLELFERMRKGEFGNGERVLRAKIDMAHSNMNMRDPVMYRIIHAPHYRTGNKWCIYPTYDWAHGLEDSIEGITHSLCTLEFEDHRPLYDWFLDALGVYHPQQIEFARLNLTYTVMSKRHLSALVEGGYVSGWDDPRLPTIRGMKRRGYPPEAIKNFCMRIGVSKVHSTIPFEFLEHCVREVLNRTARRFMGVLRPLKLVIENYPDDKVEYMKVENNPEDPGSGWREVPFSKTLYIEQDDFMENPPKRFYRLSPGREVRLKSAYFVTCTDVIKDGDRIVEIRGRIDPETRGGDAPDGRRPRSTLHWLSAAHAIDAEVRLYDRLFTVEDPLGQKGRDFKEFLNPQSLVVLKGCKVEPGVRNLKPLEAFQFLRLGYFCIDPSTTEDNLVLNRTVGLKDTWAKIKKRMENA